MKYLERKDLIKMRMEWHDDMQELLELGLDDASNKDTFILLDYACMLCTNLLDDLSPTQHYVLDKELRILKLENWELYSYSGKAFVGAKLAKVLKASKKEAKNTLRLLDRQTCYLERAATLVIDILEQMLEED